MRTTLIATCAAVVGALSFGAAAFAGDPPSTPSKTPAAHDSHAKDDGDRIICKSTEVTGSRLGAHKECRTKREWDDITLQSQRTLQDNHQTNPRG